MTLTHGAPLAPLLALALLTSGCPNTSSEASSEARPPAVREVVLNGVPDPLLTPATSGTIATGATLVQVFEGLVRYDSDLQLTPALAESWDSEDLQTYTFVLRPGLRFSDGSPLHADDVVRSFEVFLRATKDWAWVLEPIQGAKALRGGTAKRLSGCQVLDERRVKVTLEERDGLFLHLLALVPAGIHKPTPPGSLAPALGAGPWKVSGFEAAGLVLVPNEHHYGPKPAIDRLVIAQAPQSAQAFREGAIDVLDVTENAVSVEGRVLRYPGLNVQYGVFSKRVPLPVRVLVNRALDRERYCKTVLRGFAVPARGVLPPGMPGHRPTLPDLSSGEVPVLEAPFRLSARLDAPLFQQLKSDLAPHKVQLVRAEANATPDLTQHGWIADYPDPDNFLRVLFHSTSGGALNYAGFAHPKLDDLVTRARRMSAELEQGARMELYAQAEDLVLAELPWLFLWHQENAIAISDRLQGLQTCPNDLSGFLELPQTTLSVGGE